VPDHHERHSRQRDAGGMKAGRGRSYQVRHEPDIGLGEPRCISFESSGLPLAVWRPATTQLFDPGAQSGSQAGNPSSSAQSA
jgi:hypothetical protein